MKFHLFYFLMSSLIFLTRNRALIPFDVPCYLTPMNVPARNTKVTQLSCINGLQATDMCQACLHTVGGQRNIFFIVDICNSAFNDISHHAKHLTGCQLLAGFAFLVSDLP